MCLRIRRRSRGRFVEPVSAPAVTDAAVMSRYLRPPNTSLFVRNVADDTRCVWGRYSEPTWGGRRSSERDPCGGALGRGRGRGEDGGFFAGLRAPIRPRRPLNRRVGEKAAPLLLLRYRGPRGGGFCPLPLGCSGLFSPCFLSARPPPHPLRPTSAPPLI